MRLLILLFFSSFFTLVLQAQIGTGTWRLHVATGRAIDVASSDTYIYTAYENGLMRYDFTSKEKRLYTAINGISDIEISTLFYDSLQEALYIGYVNGNIDKLINDEVINIPSVKLAQIPGSKKINRFYRDITYVYVATDFSVLQLDTEKDEIKETFYPTGGQYPIVDVTVVSDTIYALTQGKLLFGLKNNPTLPASSAWNLDNRLESLSTFSYSEIEKVGNELYVLYKSSNYGEDTVYHLIPQGRTVLTNYPYSLEINKLTQHQGKLDVLCDGAILSYNQNQVLDESVLTFYLGIWFKALGMTYVDSYKWVADGNSGLLRIIEDQSYEYISYPGPPNNDYFAMDWKAGKLAVASGRLEFKSPGFLRNGIYSFEDEKWLSSNPNNISAWNGIDIHDFIAVAVNPKNTDEIAAATYSAFPVSVVNQKDNTCAVYDENNSTLSTSLAGNGWSLASDLSYDPQGALWVVNGYTERPLHVKDTTGVWYNFDCGINARNQYTTKLAIDYSNNVWFATESEGLFGLNYNKTLSNPSDDKLVHVSSSDLNNIDIPSSNITAIAADFDNEIWIGTDAGFAVLYNSNGAFNTAAGQYSPQRIKVLFEGNTEYVLGSTHITDIEVDGGNRKWIATASSGLVLLSADGSEIITQFTKENSPLISNNIYDLKLNHDTGELFIITDLGLVSYRTDATYEDPTYSDVKVFPNPVRPNYEGPITIQGIRYDSDIKVTDVAGNIVFQTTSNGGTATWNGRTLDGQKAAAGVYLIWTATNSGSGRKVGKVVLVN
jgi:hypothetical protein